MYEYKVFLKEDGQSFVHHSIYQNDEIQHQLLNLPAFLYFQEQRDTKGLLHLLIIKKWAIKLR